MFLIQIRIIMHKGGGIIFKEASNLEELQESISRHIFVFVYVTQPGCSVCHGLQPQIEAILSDFPKVKSYQVNIRNLPAFSGAYEVYTAPTLLLFVDGKEYMRYSRIVQTNIFKEKLDQIYKARLDQQ